MLQTLSGFLKFPSVYRLFTWLIGGQVLRRRFIEVHLAPRPGWRVLDVGCGTGELLAYMPQGVTYVGFDPCSQYLEQARRTFGPRGDFYLGGVEDWSPQTLGNFDAVVAFGLLHHLPDAVLVDFFRKARQCLAARRGVVAVLEPCLRPGLSPLAQLLLKNDRGAFVRDRQGYEALARRVFPVTRSLYSTEGVRIPYCCLMLWCRADRG
jgi:SAM-dependent methyltransferase